MYADRVMTANAPDPRPMPADAAVIQISSMGAAVTSMAEALRPQGTASLRTDPSILISLVSSPGGTPVRNNSTALLRPEPACSTSRRADGMTLRHTMSEKADIPADPNRSRAAAPTASQEIG